MYHYVPITSLHIIQLLKSHVKTKTVLLPITRVLIILFLRTNPILKVPNILRCAFTSSFKVCLISDEVVLNYIEAKNNSFFFFVKLNSIWYDSKLRSC